MTVGWYVAGSTVAAAALGGALAGVGGMLRDLTGVGPATSLWVLAALLAAGVGLDLGVGGLRLPSVRRQVNEEWLTRYRGWVYGVGFGAQLGVGFATVVSISAVYLAFAASLLSASIPVGAVVGTAFGVIRAVAILGAARVRSVQALARVDATLRRWERPADRTARGAEVGILAMAVAAALMAG